MGERSLEANWVTEDERLVDQGEGITIERLVWRVLGKVKGGLC